MAEPIGLTSGLLTLAAFAFKTGITLYETIQSFQNHPKDVRDLTEELKALNDVLRSLTETVSAITDVDLSALNLPLLRCGKACEEFGQKLVKCSSGSGSTRASFRGWAKLKYMGDDINNFKQMLAGYKATITIAVADANLRKSSITAESLDKYRDMVKTATVDLEARLEIIDEKLESIFERTVTESNSHAVELQQFREERLSTQKCLEVCAQLSDHIKNVRLRPVQRSPPRALNSERITIEGLQECQDKLSSTTVKLEKYMEGLIHQLKSTVASEEGAAEVAMLQEEWETARQCISICSKADNNISIIENYATADDAIQFLVSTKGKTIHGRNQGLGLRTTQVGGHLSDDSLQQVSRDISRNGSRNTSHNGPSPRNNTPSIPDDVGNESSAEFQERFGRGFKLAPAPESSVVGTKSTPPKS